VSAAPLPRPSRGASAATAGPPRGVSPRFWALLLAERLEEADVLDVGTGSGRVALGLAPRCRRVLGIDRDSAALAEAAARAAALGLANLTFVALDADTREDYVGIVPGWDRPDLVVAHLCVSDAIIAAAGRSLGEGHALAFVAFHVDQWRETGRPSRFAYDEERARRQLTQSGFAVEHLEVERDVRQFASVEEGLAAAIGLEEKWRSDGRWFHYIKFLEQGGRTLTRSHLSVKARKT
jgi:SAM-dependent methyltransferase